MLRSIFLLFVLLGLITIVKEKDEEIRREKKVHRLDINRFGVVDVKFKLFIPRSIKFADELVNTKRLGVVKFYISDKIFCYKRPKDVQRNEYYLDKSCGNYEEIINVRPGEDLEFDFSESNMMGARKVALFGEENV